MSEETNMSAETSSQITPVPGDQGGAPAAAAPGASAGRGASAAAAPEYVQPLAPVRPRRGGGRLLLAAGGLVLILLGVLVASAAAVSSPNGNDQLAVGAPASPTAAAVANAAASPTPAASASPNARTQTCEDYLNNLATRLNISVSTLEQALVGAATDTIDQMVKDGRLTSDQAAYLKGQLSAIADSPCAAGRGFGGLGWFGGWMVLGPGKGGRAGWGGPGLVGPGVGAALDETAVLDVAAAALKTDRQTLLTELGALKRGEDLKTIAQKHDVAYDTLSAAIRAAVKSQLDAAVAKGTITANQETTLLQRVDAQLADGRLPWGFLGRGFGVRGHIGGRDGAGPCASPAPSAAPGA
jgi:ribosomal protein S20